ncbi:hypothetical protein ACKKBG_A12120 [Auxenochlorella protothecoides x Auxenochlorella symbiontica]
MVNASTKNKEKKGAAKDGASPDDGPSTSGLPPHLELQRTRIVCGPNMNSYTNSSMTDVEFMASDVPNIFDMARFKKGFSIDITRYEGNDMTFHMKGISCAVANSLRRIMLAETPTVAIEHVFILNNTSLISDEMLSHRLGLLPLNLHPRYLKYRLDGEPATELNTVILKMKLSCHYQPDGTLKNEKVYAEALKWLPHGSEIPDETGCKFVRPQVEFMPGVDPVNADILLAKLRLGQQIELEAHCVKGVGEEHAKWSPVATAWYRFMPEVVLLQPVKDELAKELAGELPGLITVDSDGSAVVNDPLEHDVLLEKVRAMSGEPKWQDVLQLRKVKDHFIFTIESTGAWRPHEIFEYAVKLMMAKCDKVLEGLQKYPPPSDLGAEEWMED